MKMLRIVCFALSVAGFSSCGSTNEASAPKSSNYLDSTFVSGQRFAVLESLRVSQTVNEDQFQSLKSFTAKQRKNFPEGATWGKILEYSTEADDISNSIAVKLSSASQRTDFKVVEFYFKANVYNHSEHPVRSIRGYFEFLDEEGKGVGNTPTFSIEGPIAPGDSVTGLQLQYAHDKPTGNELSDKKLSEFRDQLDQWVQIAKTKDPERFRFVRLDLELEGGLSPAEYALGVTKGADQGGEKKLKLYDWADANKEWMDKLKQPLGGASVVVTPVLTTKWEISHGKWLIFDRIAKVEKYFVANQKVPAQNFNPANPEGRLVKHEIIDFWNWPMEIRLYQGESW